MPILYERKKRVADRVIRCYLTLDCNGHCEYCSAGVNTASPRVRRQHTSPDAWAEGINRRNRACLLAGGEPFLYPELGELVNMIKVRTEIYTNLKCDATGFLSVVKRPLPILVSCHPMNDSERKLWLSNVVNLTLAGHHLRFHIVKDANWEERLAFIRDNGIENQVKVCADQRYGVKSRGAGVNERHPSVECRHRIYLFGPDGYRYHCVTKMVLGDEAARLEHIGQSDRDDWSMSDCGVFGKCVGCDNNIEGKVLRSEHGGL